MRLRRIKDPELVYFHVLKQSAKRRKLPFTLDLPGFRAWCAASGFRNLRTGKMTISVDRIDPNRGYHFDNIRLLPFHQNSLGGIGLLPRDQRSCERVE
jgi:hypothetical protein